MTRTRMPLLGLLTVLSLCLVGEGALFAQTPAQKAARKAAFKAKQKARQKAARQRQFQAPLPALDTKALDRTPTFESVEPADPSAISRTIDEAIAARLKEEGVPASPVCDDAEFVRRVYLDLTGKIPPPGKAAAFLDSKDPRKRAKLIDELLASPEYGRRQADVWTALLVERFSDNRLLRFEPLSDWLRERFNQNQPWDKLVSDLITAEGDQAENGAVTYYLANLTPDKMTDSVCRVFLGVQLQCAQCHDHPFTDWKQDEYWAMAAFFMKVQPRNNRPAQLRDGATPGVTELRAVPRRVRGLPESAKMLPAKFLQGERPGLTRTEPFRPVLAKWMTSPENPFFARAMVNRTWGQRFGRGFVNPVDDMHQDNLPSHPELLAKLAELFAADFDLKQLLRGICNSQTYQRTSRPVEGNERDEELFSRMAIKVLSPEQVYDSITEVLGEPGQGRGPGARGPRGPVSVRDRFVAFFQAGDNPDPTAYEAGIPQALRLMNSFLTARTGIGVRRYVRPSDPPARAVETLYLATLSRRPSPEEYRKVAAYIAEQPTPQQAYADVLWALLNTSEFALNH